MPTGQNLDIINDNNEFYRFQCSLMICDEDEEELVSNDSNTVNYDKFKPHFPLKNLINNNNGQNKYIYKF